MPDTAGWHPRFVKVASIEKQWLVMIVPALKDGQWTNSLLEMKTSALQLELDDEGDNER